MAGKVGGKRPGAGRPKGSRSRATIEHKATLEELARAHTATALSVLVEIASKPTATDSARVAAASAILDRGYGKPRQATEISGPNGGPIPVGGVDMPERPETYDEWMERRRRELTAMGSAAGASASSH
jgi:hypothetical protein